MSFSLLTEMHDEGTKSSQIFHLYTGFCMQDSGSCIDFVNIAQIGDLKVPVLSMASSFPS